jgi:hypothetical protein
MTSEGQEPTRNRVRISGGGLEEFGDDAVELFVAVGHAGQVAILQDRRGKARFGEDHHAGGGLQQVGAGARTDHQEEGILNLAMQPDDGGEAAEYGALAALHVTLLASPLQSRARPGRSFGGSLPEHVPAFAIAASSRRAARSLRRNCAALIT